MQVAPVEKAPRESGNTPTRPSLNPEGWVDLHCEALFGYALRRVADTETAKDLVQETLLAAWRSADRFAGKATERTWLFRILRNKIADHYRGSRPEFSVDALNELARLEEQQFNRTGLHAGAWAKAAAPAEWPEGSQAMEQSEFWDVVHNCTTKLPPHTRTAFLMREMDGHSSEEICETLGIKRNHLGVLLHRARLALRRCLELNWFKKLD
jgi:RNA polymerase sigma-70 factor (ECF subfamily)